VCSACGQTGHIEKFCKSKDQAHAVAPSSSSLSSSSSSHDTRSKKDKVENKPVRLSDSFRESKMPKLSN
jgi:hypothetical protein